MVVKHMFMNFDDTWTLGRINLRTNPNPGKRHIGWEMWLRSQHNKGLCSVVVITLDFDADQTSNNPGSNPGTTLCFHLFCSPTYFMICHFLAFLSCYLWDLGRQLANITGPELSSHFAPAG
jgi:hypothetical protein